MRRAFSRPVRRPRDGGPGIERPLGRSLSRLHSIRLVLKYTRYPAPAGSDPVGRRLLSTGASPGEASVIPLRDENPTRIAPFVVYALVALNILVYLYNGPLVPGGRNPLAGYELTPAELFTGRDYGPPTPIPAMLTIFTSMFMHANLLHIGGNMLYLWVFGNNIEDVLGHWRFLVFYLAAGVGAALAQVFMALTSTIPMVGASGAIAGVLGAYIILFPRARVTTFIPPFYTVELPASLVLGFWIAIQVINTLLLSSVGPRGGVAYAAHLGGVFSFFLGRPVLDVGRLKESRISDPRIAGPGSGYRGTSIDRGGKN